MPVQTKPTTPAQRRRRLLALKRRIQTIPLHDFEMAHLGWRTTDCGTHACVAGHCVLMPEFRKAGGRPVWRKSDWVPGKALLEARFPGVGHTNAAYAARKFLGLSSREEDRLFFRWNTHATSDAQRRAKVAQIERLIADTK